MTKESQSGGAASRVMIHALKFLAPYLAVGIFWCIASHAWLAILAYHAQILFWGRNANVLPKDSHQHRMIALALPAMAAGPLVYALLPWILTTDLGSWLEEHHVSGWAFLAMIPYFGIVHPFLEQLHWAPLRDLTPVSHFLFAGYHVLVLYSLLTVPWVIVCFVVLTSASFAWQQAQKRSGSPAMPIISHLLADSGIIVAAWLTTR